MQQIMITNKLHTGTAFAVLASDMTQNVFIPSKLALETSLRPGQKIMAQIVPNIQQPGKTTWLAISLQDAPKSPPKDTLRKLIEEELMRGPATAFELSSILGVEIYDIQAAIKTMRLAHTELYALDQADLLATVA